MRTAMPNGDIFSTMPIISIKFDDSEPVYKYVFLTKDRTVKSSARHKWLVWNTELKDIEFLKMAYIDNCIHELLILEN